ncbi:MAG: hypothetical protein KC466_14830, partial [Myxococcales bacterium]|nr:hypothetical protein [Myxococcales bacterium]
TGLAAFGVARARATGRPSLALWGAAAAVAGHGGYNGLVGLHHGLGALALIALGLVGYGFHERLFRERLLAGVARPGLVGANARIFAGAATAVFFFVPTFVFLAHGLTEGLIFAFTSVTPVALVGALYLALAHHDYALARIRRLAWRRRWDALAAECAVVQAAVPRERRGGVALRWAYARWALGDAEGALAVAEGVECPGLDLQLLMARIRAEQGSLPAAAEGVDDPLARAYRGVVEAIDALAAGRARQLLGVPGGAGDRREKLRRRATANRTIWERVPRALLGWGENRLLALGVEACGLARMEQWDAARALLDAHLGAARWVEGSSRVYVQWARARLRAHQGDHAGSEAARREALKAHFGRPIPFLAETDYHSGGSGGSLSVPDESVQDRTARL